MDLVLPIEITEYYTDTNKMSMDAILTEIKHGLAYGISINRVKHLFDELGSRNTQRFYSY